MGGRDGSLELKVIEVLVGDVDRVSQGFEVGRGVIIGEIDGKLGSGVGRSGESKGFIKVDGLAGEGVKAAANGVCQLEGAKLVVSGGDSEVVDVDVGFNIRHLLGDGVQEDGKQGVNGKNRHGAALEKGS